MNVSYLLLWITTLTTLAVLLASFNENIHVQARVYEEKSKRRLFTRRASSFARALLGTSAVFKYQRASAQKCNGMVQYYNCQTKNVGTRVDLQTGSITTVQGCGAACLTEAGKYPDENGCCFFRANMQDGYPCYYTRNAGTKSATRQTRYSGNCVGAPATCQQNGCDCLNEVCVASGSTYVCQCAAGFYNKHIRSAVDS